MPVYDKPMVFYPLSTLMLAGIREILVITTPHDRPLFQKLLGNGSQWGLRLEYAVQEHPGGIAQAFIIGREFVAGGPSALILGDNIFYGHGLTDILRTASARSDGATVFGYWVRDPQRYGVVHFDDDDRPLGIEEKPDAPRSRYAVTGLYFYDGRVADVAGGLELSTRGELEITDVNRWYLERGELVVEKLGRGFAWLDTGTHESLLQAANFIETVEQRQGLKISCVEEIAYRMGFIESDDVLRLAEEFGGNGYGQYLRSLVDGD
jgi:glucose-1-phosphate thymidylyltransferase